MESSCINSSEDQPRASGREHFTATHWSIVLGVGQADPAKADVAFEWLCRIYWYPIYVLAVGARICAGRLDSGD